MAGPPRGDLFARLAYELSGADDFAHTIDQVVEFARSTLGTDFAGITLLRAGGRRLESVGTTDPLVVEVDALQYELGEGPCVEAATESRAQHSADIATDPRWPRWGPKAAAMGVSSVLSIELHSARERIGGLNLYGRKPRQFSHEDAATAHLFAFHAGAALAAARNVDSLRTALDSRTLIGQAQGILMERFGVDADQAFNVLRRYSQDQNVKLHTVAEHLVNNRELPPLDVLAGDSPPDS